MKAGDVIIGVLAAVGIGYFWYINRLAAMTRDPRQYELGALMIAAFDEKQFNWGWTKVRQFVDTEYAHLSFGQRQTRLPVQNFRRLFRRQFLHPEIFRFRQRCDPRYPRNTFYCAAIRRRFSKSCKLTATWPLSRPSTAWAIRSGFYAGVASPGI